MYRPRRLISLVVVGLLLLSIVTPPAQAVVKSTLFLLQLLPEAPDLRWLGPPVVQERISLGYWDASQDAQVVRPASGTHSGVVLVPGLDLDPEDSVRARALEGIARLGLAVLVPPAGGITLAREHPGQAAEELLAEGTQSDLADLLVLAFQRLQDMDYVKNRRVGFMGFSVGASLAAIAAADPRIRDQVAFLHWFGGFYSALDASTALLTERVWLDGQPVSWTPNPWAVDRVERSGLVTMVEPSNVAVVATDEVEALLARLSPRGYVDRLRAPTFVLHDVGDRFIHYSESRRFWAALPRQYQGGYTEVSLFEHVMLGRGGSPGEMAKLVGHLSRALLTIL